MKNRLTLTITIMMLVAAAAITAEAQVFGSTQMRVRIPFGFNVGNRTLPAGDYTVTVLNPNSDRRVLRLRSKDGRSSAVIQTNGAESNATADAKLVFNRYGDAYFFAQAQMAGDSTRLTAVKTKAERHKEREIARNGSKTKVEVFAE